MANGKRFSAGSVSICANPRPASLSMTNHSPGLPSPEAAKCPKRQNQDLQAVLLYRTGWHRLG